MADKLMPIPNDDNRITLSSDQNKWLKRLNIQLNATTNQNSLMSPKLLSQRIRKRYYETFGTCIIYSPLSSLSLINVALYISPGSLSISSNLNARYRILIQTFDSMTFL